MMIWSILIILIPVFILIFIVLHSSERFRSRFFPYETSEENYRGLSTSGNEDKRENNFNSSLRGYCDDLQASLNPKTQREENETLLFNDSETPTNRNLSSQSVSNQLDETNESGDFTSEEVSSTSPKRCYTNSQVLSNRKKDGKKINAVSSSYFLNKYRKRIICNESRLKTIQPDEVRNESILSTDTASENLIDTKPTKTKSVFTPSSKNESEIFPSKDNHCRNLKEYSNIQLVSKQQGDGKEDKTNAFLGTRNKNFKECCKVSELLSNQTRNEREGEEHPFKDIHKRKIERHLYNYETASSQQDREKDNALLLKGNQNKSLEGSCAINQTQSKQQIDGKENKSLLSKDVHNKNIGGYLNTSQIVSTPWDLEKDESLQSKDIISKNLVVNCSNSQSLAKQQDDKKGEQILPFKSVNKTNVKEPEVILEQFCDNLLRNRCSQTVYREQDHEKDTALQSKYIQNKDIERNCPNSHLLSLQQDDGNEDKTLSSKDIQIDNIEGHSVTFLAPQDGGKNKALQSKDIQNKNLQGSCPNALLQSKQQDDRMEHKSVLSKDVHKKNIEGYLNKSETVSNQKSDRLEEKDLPPKSTHNRNPSRYFLNSELVSKQQKEKFRSRTFTSKIADNQKGVGSFMCVLFENQLYTDITFISKGNKTLLSAHRAVLAAKCQYFKNLLFGDLAKESDGMQMDLEINNVPFCIFSSIIKWFYTGNIEFSDDYTVMEIYQAAKYFRIQQLIDECRNYIKSMEITEQNVCSNLQLSNTLQVNELKRRCIRYIEQNTLSVINSSEFEKSSFNIVREICQLQCLSLKSEAELLEAILMWLNAQPNLKRNALKELERALFKCIRFLSFSTKEFSEVISKNATLFTAEESLNILLYLNNPTPDALNALPKWCNKSQRTFLTNQEKKDPGIEKRLSSEDSEVGKIKIELKHSDIVQDFSELTSILHMRCQKGMHQITSVKFFFQAEENSGCVLADLKIIVNVLPNGPKFLKFHSIRQSEITFDFERAVVVHEGQLLVMEVSANVGQSCKFFQFDKWYNDSKSHFDCFFISKPTIGRLYFISEVAYEPLAPRLNSPRLNSPI